MTLFTFFSWKCWKPEINDLANRCFYFTVSVTLQSNTCDWGRRSHISTQSSRFPKKGFAGYHVPD